MSGVSLVPSTQQEEDTIHVSGDVGSFILAVRNDAGTALAADGDYIPVTTDATGALRVTGGGGGTEFAEDTVHTTGDLGRQILSVRNDDGLAANAGLADTALDYQALQTDERGRLWSASTPAAPNDARYSSLSIDFISLAGDNIVVPLVAAQTIRVMAIFFSTDRRTDLRFKDGAATDLTGDMPFSRGSTFNLDPNGEPWFVTAAGNAFIINTGTAGRQVSGRVYFTQSA